MGKWRAFQQEQQQQQKYEIISGTIQHKTRQSTATLTYSYLYSDHDHDTTYKIVLNQVSFT